MEERSYPEALETFRALAQHDQTLVPVVWQGRALKRLGRLSEAVEVLSEGLKTRGATDERFRRAVVLWNLACYRTLMSVSCLTPEATRSIVAVLDEAIRNAPDFRDGVGEEALDRDLAGLVGNPIFEEWRRVVLDTRRAP